MNKNELLQKNNTLINPNGPDGKISAERHREINADIINFISEAVNNTSFNGLLYKSATVDTTKPAYWIAAEPGVYPNADNITVEPGYLYFLVYDGDAWGSVKIELNPEISNIAKVLYSTSSTYKYSTAVMGDANGVNVGAFNDQPVLKDGQLSRIFGRFPAAGVFTFYIADKTGSTFTLLSIHSVTVAAGEITQAIEEKIYVKAGQYIGISPVSEVKSYYGVDASNGVSWYQITGDRVVGENFPSTFVADASFSFNYETIDSNVVTKDFYDTSVGVFISNEMAYELPKGAASSIGVLLGNNVAMAGTGFISEIELTAETAGLAKFAVMERTTYNAETAGVNSNFIIRKIFTVPVEAGYGKYPVKIPVNKGEYLAQIGEDPGVKVRYTGEGTPLGWWQGGPGPFTEGEAVPLVYQPLSVLFSFRLVYLIKDDTDVETVIITASNTGFNSIRNILEGINDAGPNKKYIIKVPAGTWQEIDWKGKKYVEIEGELNGETIILCDPLGSMANLNAPADYSFPSESGKKLNAIAQPFRHLIFVSRDIICRNLTFKTFDSKYAAHIDNPGYKEARFYNCRFIDTRCNHPIGMGINGGQSVLFEKCVIECTEPGKIGAFYHNWNNQAAGNIVTFNRCKFINCDYLNVDELGSDHVDELNLYDCFTTLPSGGALNFMVDITGTNTTYWVNPATGSQEPNPVNVPYCIVVNTTGTKISALTASDSGVFNPAWAGTPQRDINKIKDLSLINF